jgi:hypothetical protein
MGPGRSCPRSIMARAHSLSGEPGWRAENSTNLT